MTLEPLPPNRWAVALALALTGLAAFAIGRYTAADPDVHEVERVVYRDRVVEVIKTVTVKQAAETRVVYRDRVRAPDGTVHEREVERTDTRATETAATDTSRVEAHDATRETARTVTSAKPNWRVGVLAGAQMRFDPLSLSPALGAHVERRILGPVWLGVWGLHAGTAGLSLSVEF